MLLFALLVSVTAVFGLPNNTPNNVYTAGESMTLMLKPCNTTKSCFAAGVDCIAANSCTAAATVVQNNDLYEFELRTVAGVYVAVGLSNDDKMGDDSIVACIHDATTEPNVVKLAISWNTGHSNNAINTTLTENGITLLDSSVADGSIYCKFTRKSVTNIGGTIFDLHKSKYHLLVASGIALKPEGTIARHAVRLGSTHSQFLHDIGMFDGYAVPSAAATLLVFSLLLPCQLIFLLYHSSG